MFRCVYVGGLALALILMFLSCQDEQPTSPASDVPAFVQIVPPDAIIAPEEELRAAAFELFITDETGTPFAGVLVQLSVISGPGEVAYRSPYSDDEGIVQALYYVTVPFGDTTATIRATTGGDTAAAEVSLSGLPAPDSISLRADPPLLRTAEGVPASSVLTAQLSDRRGNTVSGCNVAFTLLEGEAKLGGMVATDSSGTVSTTVTLDGTWFGDVVVMASVVQRSEEILSDDDLRRIKLEADRTLIERFLHGFAPSINRQPLAASVTVPVEGIETLSLPSDRRRRSDDEAVTLMLEDCSLELHADPGNIMLEDWEEDTITVRVWAILYSSQGRLVDNAPIRFTSDRGHLYYASGGNYHDFYPHQSRRSTGPRNDGRNDQEQRLDDDQHGQAVVYWRASYWDIWDPFGLWLEVAIQINAWADGLEYVAADPLFIFVTRH